VLLHHLTTRWGTLKYEALVRATGAPIRAGLENGRGAFLTHRVHDAGFGASHEVDYWTDVVSLLGAVEPPREMELVLDAAELAEADHRWTDLGLKGGAVAVLHPGSGAFSVARRWPPGRFAEVGDALVSHGLRVAVVAGPDEAPLARAVCEQMRAPSVTISAPGSVRVLAAMLRRARLFVGNDSGVMHCAAAVGVPVVAVFGLSNHRAWGPYPPERHAVVRLDLPCSPCLYTGYGLGTPQGCPPRSCLVDLDAETVTASALRLLAASEPRPGEDDGV
jgi:heptosyltransferase-2